MKKKTDLSSASRPIVETQLKSVKPEKDGESNWAKCAGRGQLAVYHPERSRALPRRRQRFVAEFGFSFEALRDRRPEFWRIRLRATGRFLFLGYQSRVETSDIRTTNAFESTSRFCISCTRRGLHAPAFLVYNRLQSILGPPKPIFAQKARFAPTS